jgi:hypothetical protein
MSLAFDHGGGGYQLAAFGAAFGAEAMEIVIAAFAVKGLAFAAGEPEEAEKKCADQQKGDAACQQGGLQESWIECAHLPAFNSGITQVEE